MSKTKETKSLFEKILSKGEEALDAVKKPIIARRGRSNLEGVIDNLLEDKIEAEQKIIDSKERFVEAVKNKSSQSIINSQIDNYVDALDTIEGCNERIDQLKYFYKEMFGKEYKER